MKMKVVLILTIFLQISQICLMHSIKFNDTSISYENKANFAFKSFGKIEHEMKRAVKEKEKTLIDDLIKEAQSIFQDCKSERGFTKPLNKFKTTAIDSKSLCQDPAPSVMLANLVKLQYIFKDLGGLLDIREVQDAFKKYINPFIPVTHQPLVFGSQACDSDDMNITQINELSICPWHANVQIRENRYPMMVSHAKCNCQHCLHLNRDAIKLDAQFKCAPVYRLTPALIRDENCDPTVGVYEWKPILEKIAVSCVCSRAHKLFLAVSSP
jgi:hypothetical protein